MQNIVGVKKINDFQCYFNYVLKLSKLFVKPACFGILYKFSILYLTELVMTNPCSTHPCLNNGTCFDDATSAGMNLKLINALDFRCFCPIGYSGIVCESKMNKISFSVTVLIY